MNRLIVKTGIGQSVRLLPPYPHYALPPLYALADIYVSVPTWDAGPVSLKEAMAAHCTPIISDVAGPREWIWHGENGLVVPVRDVEKLASAISDLIADPEKRRRFDQINRRLIVDYADHDVQMNKAVAIYFNLVDGGGPQFL